MKNTIKGRARSLRQRQQLFRINLSTRWSWLVRFPI